MTPEGMVCVLEVAARPIGGLCSRVLTFEGGHGLEHVLLQHAVGIRAQRRLVETEGHAVERHVEIAAGSVKYAGNGGRAGAAKKRDAISTASRGILDSYVL